jgi:hypothetical protein
MSKRNWAVGKFRAVLPITNRLRFGRGALTHSVSSRLHIIPSRRNSSAAPRMTAGSASAHDGGT